MAVREFTGELVPLEIKKPTFREFTGDLVPLEEKPASAVSQIPTGGPTAPAARPEDQSVLRQFADVPLKLAGGVTSGIRMISDAFGADTALSKSLRGAEDWIAELYSAQSKQDSKRMAQIMKEAEDKGVLDQVMAGVKAFQVAPIDLVVNALGTSAPAILASVGAFVLGAPVAATAAATLGTGAVMGAGTIKGAVYDATKEILTGQKELSLTPEQIEKIAVDAQAYGGKNLDSILLGSIIGAVGAKTGAEPIIARALAKQIAGKAAEKGATETALKAASREAAELAAKRGITKQAAITGGKEFGTEFLQGGQEQLAQNIAQQREGFDVPTMRGVVGQGTLEGLAGLGMGAVAGGRDAYTGKREFYRDQPSTKASEDAIRETVFTTAGEDKRRTPAAPSAEDVNLLMPATDAAGKALTTAAPETTTAKGQVDTEAAAAEQTQQQRIDAARAYVAKVDAGEKPNQKIINAFGKDLGIKFPQAIKSNVAKLNFIRDHLAQQGAPSVATTGTVDQTGGASAGVAGQPSTVGPAGGTVPGGVAPAGTTATSTAAGKGAQPGTVTPPPAAPTKTIADLSPELQAEVQRRQDEIADIEMDGGDASKQKKFLNAFLQKQGVTGTLSAKKSVEKDFLEQGELPVALPGEERTEQQIEQERVAAYQESLGKTVPKYDLTDEDQRLYNEVREEVNAQAEAANKRRDELVQKLNEAIAEYDALIESIDTEKEADTQSEATKAKLDAALEKAAAAENALIEHGGKQRMLPEYTKKFAADYKDVYFSNITAALDAKGNLVFGSSKREHRKAAKALQEYLSRTGGREKEEVSAQERRIINHYEENRAQYSKIFPVNFPRWQDLTDQQKFIFAREMKTLAGVQQDVAFAKLGVKLIEDNKQLSEGEKRERQNEINRKAEVAAESEKTQAELKELRRKAPVGIGASTSTLPDSVVQMIVNNDLQGVLKYMSSIKTTALSSPFVRIRKAVAEALLGLNLNTKIKIVDNLGEDLAQYDPATDTILVTKEGLSSGTILHEIIHAGTVKVINEYLYGDRKSLSLGQLNAIKVLEKIMKETRDLASDHPNAYKSLFEFVSYALTDDQLQQDLQDASFVYPETKGLFELFGLPREEVQSILPDAKSAWTAFKLSIARILKVRGTYLPKAGKPTKDVEPNFVMEIAAAFEDILAKPTTPIYLPALPAKKPKKGAAPAAAPEKPEDKLRKGGVNNEDTRKFYELSTKEKIVSTPSRLWKTVSTAAGWREIVRRFQDKSVESRSLFRKLDMAGLINRDMDGAFNNVPEQGDLATGEARNFVNQYLRVPMDNLKQLVGDYAKLTKKSLDGVKGVLVDLHMFAEMFHEPERRNVKWVTSVPLSTTENLMHNGKKISAAQRRIDIMGDPRTGKPGIKDRVELTEAQQKQLWAELTYLANNHADPAGDSPRIKSERMRKRVQTMDINKDSPLYNVLGINQDEVNLRMQEYQALPDEQRELLDKIFAQAKEITKISAELDKIGNYWSFPVSNLVGMYGYEHYMPFKGISKHSVTDELLDFNSKSTGKELQDVAHAADGRFATSDNPFLQMMSDAFRAAGRAGRRNYMQSIKNAVEPNKLNPTGTGVIKGRVVKHVEFAERNTVDLTEFKGGSNIFVYNPDGSVDIVQVSDPKLLNALRYSYRDAAPMLDMANSVTGFFGAMHTRYNYNFAPLNFVRDSLTNAWTMGAELGPLKSAQYIKQISAAVVKNGLGKAMEVAILHEKGDPVSQRMLADMAKKDPFVKHMVEYLQRGGKTTYLESFSLKSNLHDLDAKLGKRRIMDKVDQFNEIVDVWNNMFEFTSRAAAFALRKEELVKKNIAKGMTEAAANRAAGTEAAAWTKNLANFEKAGEYARGMGALYMFIRASATGAVRAGEATLPAFRTLNSAVNDLPAVIRDDPKALEEFKTNYKKQQRNAQIMVGALIGSGMFAYWMASLMAPDDEWKRNSVNTDNMAQWTRFARFHIPNSVSEKLGMGKDVVFQMPWGFGLGAFAAFGAQIIGLAKGAQSFKEFVGNSITSFADSFLPLPLSKIPPTESPESAAKWAIDTVTPTAFRPLFEFAMNTNGIGQAINSAATRRMGDAYTGGDRIPDIYKDVADWMYTASLGEYDVSPNTLYFFANSYLDGLAKLAQTAYSWASLERGEKAFNVKTDLPFFGSFFGAKTNVDSREYGNMEKKVLEIDKRMNTMALNNPERLAMYEVKYPLHTAIVDAYRARQGELNRLRSEAKEIRTNRNISPKDREELLRISIMQQNMLKNQMVRDFKAYGLDD